MKCDECQDELTRMSWWCRRCRQRLCGSCVGSRCTPDRPGFADMYRDHDVSLTHTKPRVQREMWGAGYSMVCGCGKSYVAATYVAVLDWAAEHDCTEAPDFGPCTPSGVRH